MDVYIYHGEPLKSDMFCLIFGVTGVFLFFIAQLRLAVISKWFERTYPNLKIYRIIYEDFVYLFVYLTLILLWRGCWNMNIRYVITDPEIGGPVNHCIGLVALLLLRTFSIIAGCGCIRDGGEALGGAFFPIQYLYIYTNPRLFDKEAYMKSKDKGRIPSVKDPKLSGEINHGYNSNEAVTVATVLDTVVENYKF